MSSSKIAVIGAGIAGRTLAARFANAGHAVTLGLRDCHPRKDRIAEFADRIGAQLTGIGPAIDCSDVILLAIDRTGMTQSVPTFGARMDGRTIIDATEDASLDNLAMIAEHAPTARVYRAFNSLDWGNLAGDMTYSGPAGSARNQVEALIATTGLRPVWIGAAAVEPVTSRVRCAMDQGRARWGGLT